MPMTIVTRSRGSMDPATLALISLSVTALRPPLAPGLPGLPLGPLGFASIILPAASASAAVGNVRHLRETFDRARVLASQSGLSQGQG